jgi:hypothetical protein
MGAVQFCGEALVTPDDHARQRRVDEAHDLAGVRERIRQGDPPLLQAARKLHYCVRTYSYEDAFGHCEDLLRRFFEESGGVPVVSHCGCDRDDHPLVVAGQLVASLTRLDEDVETHTSRAYAQLLLLLRQLFAIQTRARATLANGMEDLLRRVKND